MNAMAEARMQRRHELRTRGYMPIPLFGKVPPLKNWSGLSVISADNIRLWSQIWPDAANTGCLTRNLPTLDLDILNEEAARACEALIERHCEDRGRVLVRIGKAPKRAILFQTNQPFGKVTLNVVAANGSAEKIELLCDGQQIVVDGIHPDIKQPYRWFGGVPWDVPRAELPYVTHEQAIAWTNELAELLTGQFGYRSTSPAASPTRTITNGRVGANGEERWRELMDNIRHGRDLHGSINSVAAGLIKSGMHRGAAVHLLQALVELSDASHGERWESRYRDVPRSIDTAVKKYGH
jgi:Bifunctional DNA primase/polymerase, N-terminal